MALEHAKAALELDYTKIYVVGRTKNSFEKHFKDIDANPTISLVSGGLDEWFRSTYFNASIVHINAVAIDALKQITERLLDHNVQRILLEKPGALTIKDLVELKNSSARNGSLVVVGYNRRQYASVRKLKEILVTEPITSFEFEFTEWVDRIDQDDYSKSALVNWLKSNSAHVIDTAFYLAGDFPTELNVYATGEGKVKWHPIASVFVGSGMVGSIPFTYNSDWTSQGRWKIHFRTTKGKYILEPMEELQFIPKNSITPVKIEKESEKQKPGLIKQIELFENSDIRDFCTLENQIKLFEIINRINNTINVNGNN